MKTITLNVDEETRDALDEEREERGYSSRSEYLREIIENRHEADEVREEYEERLDELRTELDRAEARADDLRRQLQAREENVEEKVETLVERTERQDDALAQVLEEQRRGVFGRAKRWLLGDEPPEDDTED
jgi:Arc/MetJ-type ribon-helix-helix transcriptional regulator